MEQLTLGLEVGALPPIELEEACRLQTVRLMAAAIMAVHTGKEAHDDTAGNAIP